MCVFVSFPQRYFQMCELTHETCAVGKSRQWNVGNSFRVESECTDVPVSRREFGSRGLCVCSACSKKEFHEAYKSCWLRRRAQDRNDGREGEEGGGFILWKGCGVSLTGLIKWQDALWQQEHYLPLKRPGKGPSNWLPPLFVLPHVLRWALLERIIRGTCSWFFSPTDSLVFDQHCDVKLTEKASFSHGNHTFVFRFCAA